MSIRLDSVTYTYDKGTVYRSDALRNISLSIGDGEFVAVIGKTGSGKSTLIQLFNALIRPTDGRVYYNGEDIWADGFDRRALRFHVGLVFQYSEHQFFETTVLEDVCFGPKNKGLSDDDAKAAAASALKAVGVPDDILNKSPFEISGGTQRRAAIAGILAMKPDVLVLDEPTAGLDPKGRREILELISRLHKEQGITVVLVSHNMEDAAEYADRIIVLNNGEKAFDAPAREVFFHYRELEKMSLAAPQITYIMHALKKRGMDVDTSALTVEEAKQSIFAALKVVPC